MSLLQRIRAKGLGHAFRAVLDHANTPRLASYPAFAALVRDKVGLEIGGPSFAFHDRGMLPLYRCAARIDNCNYAEDSIVNGHVPGGRTFQYYPKREPGWTFICEAADLRQMPDAVYDFILASHCLEHCANPIKAIRQWSRVARPNAACVVVLPDYHHTFDHRRQPTPLSHLIEDYERDTGEDDLSHLQESLELHDLTMDPQGGIHEQFAERCRNNFATRKLHHHVFDEADAEAMLTFSGLTVLHKEIAQPFHIVMLARL
jgi:SAM-dependent methyltransferase